MEDLKAEKQMVTQAYRELTESNQEIFKVIVNLAVALLLKSDSENN